MLRRTLTPFFMTMIVAASARADVASEARFFDAIGRRAYEARDFEKALDAFLLVHEIAPSPRSLYNVAVCAEFGMKPDVAFAYYREYLRGTDADQERRQDAEKRLSALKGRLALVEVTSDPPGSDIFVDRKDQGSHGATPRVIVVTPGERQLFVGREGYLQEAAKVNAVAGATAPVSVRLTPRLGDLVVKGAPASATLEFFLGDLKVLAQLEAGRYRLPVGRYVVKISAPGYASTQTKTVVVEGAPSDLNVALAPLERPTGKLLVSTGKVVADVYIDGKKSSVSPATLGSLDVGEHLLEVKAAGYRTWQRKVSISKERAAFVEVTLERGTP